MKLNPISYDDFLAQVRGARALDREWIVESLFEQFAFGDDGAYYLSPEQRGVFRAIDFLDRKLSEIDWGAQVRKNPGYVEPLMWVLQ